MTRVALVTGAVSGIGAAVAADSAPTVSTSSPRWSAGSSASTSCRTWRTWIPQFGRVHTAAYSVAKGGLVLLTTRWRSSWRRTAFASTASAPRGFRRRCWAKVTLPADAGLLARLGGPLAGLATPEQVASAVAWLASDAAARATGVALPMDGGRMA